NAKLQATRDHTDFAGCKLDHAQLCAKAQAPQLWHDQQFAVCVIKKTPLHRAVAKVDMNANACACRHIAITSQRNQATNKISRLAWRWQRIPAQLIWRRRRFGERPATQ